METWPHDGDLINAYTLLAAKFAELLSTPFDVITEQTSTPSIPGLEECLSVDPQLIFDEYARMEKITRLLDNEGRALGLLDLMQNSKLAGWKGPAADAFHLHLTRIKSAGTSQQVEVANLMLGLGTAARLTAALRTNFLELVSATIATVDVELGNEATRTTKANVSLMADLAKDILALDPKKLLAGSIGVLIGVTKNMLERQIEGGGAEQIHASYVSRWEQLLGEYTSGLTAVRFSIDQHHVNAMTTKLPVEEPLPSITDIDSPDFSYEHFWSVDRSGEHFTPKVNAERAEVAAEDEAEDSTISKRLGTAE